MFTCFLCKWYFFPQKWTLNGKESRIFIWRHKFMLSYDMYCHMLYIKAPDIFWFTKLDQTTNLLKNQCKTLPWNLIKIRKYKRECYLSLIVPCGPVFLNSVTAIGKLLRAPLKTSVTKEMLRTSWFTCNGC